MGGAPSFVSANVYSFFSGARRPMNRPDPPESPDATIRIGISSCLLGRECALRRWSQARPLRDRHARSVRPMGARLSRGRDRPGRAAGDAATGGRRRRPAHGRRVVRDGPHGRHAPFRRAEGAPTRAARSLGLHLEESVAVLRDGTRQGLRRGGTSPEERARTLRSGLEWTA